MALVKDRGMTSHTGDSRFPVFDNHISLEISVQPQLIITFVANPKGKPYCVKSINA